MGCSKRLEILGDLAAPHTQRDRPREGLRVAPQPGNVTTRPPPRCLLPCGFGSERRTLRGSGFGSQPSGEDWNKAPPAGEEASGQQPPLLGLRPLAGDPGTGTGAVPPTRGHRAGGDTARTGWWHRGGPGVRGRGATLLGPLTERPPSPVTSATPAGTGAPRPRGPRQGTQSARQSRTLLTRLGNVCSAAKQNLPAGLGAKPGKFRARAKLRVAGNGCVGLPQPGHRRVAGDNARSRGYEPGS